MAGQLKRWRLQNAASSSIAVYPEAWFFARQTRAFEGMPR
jgi:hypothetical protein